MQNTLIDNSSEELKLSTILKQCFINPNINEIKIATGYWDLPGMVLIYDELKSFLEREDTIFQLLIGKDPRIAVSQQEKIKIKDPSYPKDFIKTDIQNLELKSEYQKVVKLLLNYCTDDENSKIQVRVFRKNENEETQFLHSKCYIFNGKDVSIGIIGSSNFTQKGLEGNSELNYLETTRQIVKYPVEGNLKGHIGWFNEKWEISEVWNQTFEEILKESPLAPPPTKPTISELTTPYQVYIKFLQSQWGDMLDSKNTSMLENFLPQEVQKLQYQLDAVNQGYSILKRHGGFILADVVGLGKTMVGVLTIKRFLEDINREGREKNVLIITPPAIKTSWENTIELFNDNSFSSHIQIVTIGSIGKLVDSQENEEELEEIENEELNISGLDKNFGLILIDESHKFRNSETQMYKALDNLIENISPQPYVVLLSATPQNNTPSDLKNQIYLFQRERHNTTLDRILGRNLSAFFSKIESQYEQLKKDPKANNDELIALSRKVRACVLDDLLVRRTRTDIKKYYQTDANGIKFPQVKGPNLLKYEMSDELVQLFLDTMEKIAPILRGRDIKRYGYEFADLYLLFIPWHFPLHLAKPEIKGASLEAEKSFENQYPAIYNHFLQYKKELSNRNKAETGIRYEWYALQRWGANYWEDFYKQKIAWNRIASEKQFSLIDADIFIQDSMHFFTGKHLNFLTAVLNSRLYKILMHMIVGQAAGGNAGNSDNVKQLKVVVPNQFLEDKIIQLLKEKKYKEIDKLIYELYNLTDEEISFIENI